MCLIFACINGCSTSGVVLENQNYSMNGLRSSIISVIGEPRQVTDNQREFQSDYFRVGKLTEKVKGSDQQRSFIKISIFGDRRPYDVKIQVPIEEKSDGVFEETGSDEGLEIEIENKLKQKIEELNKDGRSIVDEFRAF